MDPSTSGPSRLAISHPYPPSYRSNTSPSPSHGGGGADPNVPPSQSYAFDFQRRRDERYGLNPPIYGEGTGYGQGGGGGGGGGGNDGGRIAGGNDRGVIAGGNGQGYPALAPPMGRDRSGSEGSSFMRAKEGGRVGSREGYPAGWTNEDEEAERAFLAQGGLVDWQKVRSWRYWVRRDWWVYYLVFALISVVVILMTIFHDQIVTWLTPLANWMKGVPAGWTIPIAILFVLSFPPLFGHEIVIILVGVIWGLWIGFGITAAGTLLGEVGNFYAFKYCLRSRAEKLERKNFNYAVMAHVVREGGFFVIFMARLSAIPGHFTTAVFATCGMNIVVFSIACILTMPKQLTVVYLGVLFANKDAGSESKTDKIISRTVLAIGILVTILAAWYIYHKMQKARILVWRRQRMELASRGVSLDPVSGQRRASYGKMLDTGSKEDVEAQSPILNRHGSYQTPYDISYRPADNMSVYEVDGPRVEQDVGYGYNPAESTESFPQAQPLGATRMDTPQARSGPSRDNQPQRPSFPIPMPAGHSAGGVPSPQPQQHPDFAGAPPQQPQYDFSRSQRPDYQREAQAGGYDGRQAGYGVQSQSQERFSYSARQEVAPSGVGYGQAGGYAPASIPPAQAPVYR